MRQAHDKPTGLHWQVGPTYGHAVQRKRNGLQVRHYAHRQRTGRPREVIKHRQPHGQRRQHGQKTRPLGTFRKQGRHQLVQHFGHPEVVRILARSIAQALLVAHGIAGLVGT